MCGIAWGAMGGARARAVNGVTDVTDAAARMKRAQRVVARMSRATLSHVTFVAYVTVARRMGVMGGDVWHRRGGQGGGTGARSK